MAQRRFEKNYNNDIEYNAEYKNWNTSYEHLANRILKITQIEENMFLDISGKNGEIILYCSLISSLFTTHAHFFDNRVKIKKDLRRIENFLLDRYLNQLKEFPESAKKNKIKVFKELREIFEEFNSEFSKKTLTVSVNKFDISKPSDKVENPEDKKKLKFLESAGLIR